MTIYKIKVEIKSRTRSGKVIRKRLYHLDKAIFLTIKTWNERGGEDIKLLFYVKKNGHLIKIKKLQANKVNIMFALTKVGHKIKRSEVAKLEKYLMDKNFLN